MAELGELEGTHWTGTAELWLDPLGNDVTVSTCAIAISGASVRYTWSHEGEPHQGSISLAEDRAEFVDSWHQPDPMACRILPAERALFRVEGAYGPEADWGWRTALCHRAPTGQLVLQMTNIAPWGEEARAVRMTCEPVA